MKKFILLCSILLVSAFSLYPQPNQLISDLEHDYFYNGDFVNVYNRANDLSGNVEIILDPNYSFIVNLYKFISETQLNSINSKEAHARLDKLEENASNLYGALSRYMGLVYLAKAHYHLENDHKKALVDGKKSVEILSAVAPNTIELACALMASGYAYIHNGDSSSGEKLLLRSLNILKKNKQQKSWIAMHTHSCLAAAYVFMGKANDALEEVGKSMDIFNSMEKNGRTIRLVMVPYGMSIFIFTSMGLYDNAIQEGKDWLALCKTMQMENNIVYGNTLQNIGTAYLYKKDNKTGLDYYYLAKDHYEKYGYTDCSQYQMLIRYLNNLEQK